MLCKLQNTKGCMFVPDPEAAKALQMKKEILMVLRRFVPATNVEILCCDEMIRGVSQRVQSAYSGGQL